VHALIKELQDKGIIVLASAILFLEHHDAKALQEDIDWVISLGSSLVQFMNFTPFPGTALHAKLNEDGLLRHQHYRHSHGCGELFFDHPHFPNPEDHAQILCEAFRQKYETDGPGIVMMALTGVNGYERAQKDFEQRAKDGLVWNPETLRYEKSVNPKPDEFMKSRMRRMGNSARLVRPTLVAAWLYAPNAAARKKARGAMKDYTRVYGRAKLMDYVAAGVLVATGAAEHVRLLWSKVRGRESIVRQPRCRRTEYPERMPASRAGDVNRTYKAKHAEDERERIAS